MSRSSHVLVGYDGTNESERALRWAVEEARARRLPLTVCHAWRWPYPVSDVGHEGVAIVKRMGGHLLDHGVALARRAAPSVTVRGTMAEGPADAALMHEGEGADLIVVGSHDRDELPVGSTALRLPARARVPVLVVRRTATKYGKVVVGADGSRGGDAALGFAFEEAALRGWGVRAVYGCWEAEAVGGDLALLCDDQRLRELAGTRLERAVAPWRVKYPHVETRTALVLRPPRQALFEAAESADLLVVGDRGAGGFDPLRLGAVSGAVLQHVPCTVAVVPSAPRG
ncbi:universal stress protein [Actinomadura rifamycini]|uniref:universal stress protein n=1 Tax=Actinomadura rifamycini TaxID=31962 RepID=UPI0007E8E355|nr:universal stress protein [Actinomadura rifamycini]